VSGSSATEAGSGSRSPPSNRSRESGRAFGAPRAQNHVLYLTWAEPRDGGNGLAVGRARLVREGSALRLDDLEVLWRMTPTIDSTKHFGGRLVFGRGGELFVTTGERFVPEGRARAQDPATGLGKVVRIAPGPPVVWSRGHRNILAAAIHPRTGALWIVEHGARGETRSTWSSAAATTDGRSSPTASTTAASRSGRASRRPAA
jgi:glucose/arabinose dehydrogenase